MQLQAFKLSKQQAMSLLEKDEIYFSSNLDLALP